MSLWARAIAYRRRPKSTADGTPMSFAPASSSFSPHVGFGEIVLLLIVMGFLFLTAYYMIMAKYGTVEPVELEIYKMVYSQYTWLAVTALGALTVGGYASSRYGTGGMYGGGMGGMYGGGMYGGFDAGYGYGPAQPPFAAPYAQQPPPTTPYAQPSGESAEQPPPTPRAAPGGIVDMGSVALPVTSTLDSDILHGGDMGGARDRHNVPG